MVEDCEKCHGTRIVKEKDGSIHTCSNCLAEGRLDMHSKDVKDSGIKV